ncbi:hypothetical protein [Sphingomonas crusticola]|uniref:hypothetical protein n=1 Tax=Sphingomonas crusticola TaxID=1697973 RepID=UPI000E26360D|nr:hypothetical protein [Sphingomonas crusticola]
MSRAAPAVPDKAALAAPVVQSAIEALAQDAREYARLYSVPLDQAMRELQAQQDSVAATDALQQTYRDRLAGLAIAHDGGLRIVVLLTGSEAVPDQAITAAGLTIPVTFQTGAPATRDRILAAIAAHQAEIRAALRNPPGMGVDPRSGMLAVMVKAADVGADGPEALAARLSEIATVPVRVVSWGDADTNLMAEGGGRVIGFDPAIGRRGVCTSGFVVTDGAQSGIATAAHCPDQIDYVEPGGGEVPLTMIGAWGAFYQDVQIHTGAGPLAPLFYADKGKTVSRPVTSWRNRTSTRSGDVVCHRGERTGYSCAEVQYVDYAPPGDLCAGPCEPSWVAVRGPDCKGGDSGGPVFSATIAFGLVKGSSYTADGRCRLYYYMSTDYLPPGWTLAYQSGGAAPQNKKHQIRTR